MPVEIALWLRTSRVVNAGAISLTGPQVFVWLLPGSGQYWPSNDIHKCTHLKQKKISFAPKNNKVDSYASSGCSGTTSFNVHFAMSAEY